MSFDRSEYMKEYYQKNKESIYEKRNKRGRHGEHIRYYAAHKGAILSRNQVNDQIKRMLVIDHYSNGEFKCAYCGIDDVDVLTTDHMNGGGTQHRKTCGNHVYRELIRDNFPKGYQVLCFNCNWKKRLNQKET